MKKVMLTILILILIISVNVIMGYTDSVTLDDPTEDGYVYERTIVVCPFVYSWNGSEFIYEGEIIRNLYSKELEQVDYLELHHLENINGEYILRVSEEKDETTYIDFIALKLIYYDGFVEYAPLLSAKRNDREEKSLIGEEDGRHLKMWQGDILDLRFKGDRAKEEVEKVELVTKGYYLAGFQNPDYYRINDATYLRAGYDSPGGQPQIYRGYVEWDISSIPDGATITDVIFKYHAYTNEMDCYIPEVLGARPSIAGNQALWEEIGEGTVYADPAGFPVVGTNQQVDLGASADSDLQNQLTDNWFAIGIRAESESYPPNASSYIYSEEYASTPDPTLYVEYTPPYWTGPWNTKEISKWNTKEIMKWNTIE